MDVRSTNGHTVMVDRAAPLRQPRRLAAGEAACYERRRRQRLWREVQPERAHWTETPPAFVEAPPERFEAVYR